MIGRAVIALAVIAGAAALPPSTLAQTAVPVKSGKAWKHPHSKIVVPATLAGFKRERATDLSKDYLDVATQFDSADGAESLSVYIFRNTNGTVPVWFSQAQMAIESRDIYAGPVVVMGPEAVPLAGTEGGQLMRAVYRGGAGSEYASTGLAFFSVGPWYVKIRASSTTRSPEDLAALMEQAISELTLPAKLAPSKDLAPVAPCASLLEFPVDAKDAPKDGASMLLTGLLGMVVRDGGDNMDKDTKDEAEDEAAGPWCRDVTFSGVQTLYRPGSATDKYLIALGDSGRGVFVGPDFGASVMAAANEGEGDGERFSVTYYLPAEQVNFVAQDRLPSPQRVVELINGSRRTVTVPTWGKKNTIQVNSDAM